MELYHHLLTVSGDCIHFYYLFLIIAFTSHYFLFFLNLIISFSIDKIELS